MMLNTIVTARASDSMFYALTLCALQIVFTITITLERISVRVLLMHLPKGGRS